MIIFDYVYYKITRLYLKSEGQYAPVAIFSMTISLTILILELLFSVYNFFVLNPFKSPYRDLGNIEILLIASFVFYFIYQRYKKGYYFFRNRFQNESKLQSFFGWLFVVIFHIMPFIIYFLNN